jgi:hypothetical protein
MAWILQESDPISDNIWEFRPWSRICSRKADQVRLATLCKTKEWIKCSSVRIDPRTLHRRTADDGQTGNIRQRLYRSPLEKDQFWPGSIGTTWSWTSSTGMMAPSEHSLLLERSRILYNLISGDEIWTATVRMNRGQQHLDPTATWSNQQFNRFAWI